VVRDQGGRLADAGAGEAGGLRRLRFLAGGEEDAIVGSEAERLDEPAGRLLAVILRDRAAELAALLGDIAQAGMALAARPVVHIVKEFAALAHRAWRRNGADHAAFADDAVEQTEPRAFEMVGDVADQDGIAQ